MRSRRPSGAWRPAGRELGCSRVSFTESTGRCIDSPVDVTRSPTCCPGSRLYCSPQPGRAPDGREPSRCSDCPRPMVSRLSPRTSGSSTSPAGTTSCGPIQKVRSRPTNGRARFAPSKPRVTFVAGSGRKDYALSRLGSIRAPRFTPADRRVRARAGRGLVDRRTRRAAPGTADVSGRKVHNTWNQGETRHSSRVVPVRRSGCDAHPTRFGSVGVSSEALGPLGVRALASSREIGAARPSASARPGKAPGGPATWGPPAGRSPSAVLGPAATQRQAPSG